MKKEELLKVKSIIVAMAMTISLSSCQKATNDKAIPITSKEAVSSSNSTDSSDSLNTSTEASQEYLFAVNCSAVVFENDRAIIYDLSGYSIEQDNIVLKLPTGIDDRIIVPSNNTFIFETAKHHEDAVAFANYNSENVITYKELTLQESDKTKEQKLKLTK